MAILPVLKLGSIGHYVTLLQMDLNGLSLNYNLSTIDGKFGPKTEAVVKNFQDRFQLLHDGIVGPITWRLLTENVKAVQRLLNVHGYPVGAADGWYGHNTVNGVKNFQRAHNLTPDGILNPRTRQELFNPNRTDHFETRPSSTSLDSLVPHVAALARQFLSLTKAAGMDVRITAAFRSWDEADLLYAQGRTAPGPIVSNAQGGNSYHNWGLAFDAAPFVNGKISEDTAQYKKMGALGEQVGLEWGGTFKSLVDYPHFQYTYGLNTWDLLNGVRPWYHS
ncbi:MAG TPA: peptidoglycan-binding protein [Candidatus Angelobacter sp.]|nr:peptidoglycan-binding protein [Candidatus Angelobacter sp.]